jgi:acyl-CoA synthetase (AMP-forming)/AMP-acid ligase II
MTRLLPIDALHDTRHLGVMLAELAARRGDAPFWIRPGVTEPRTLGEVVADARRVAAWFAAEGLRPGDRVALITDDLEQWALTALAATLGGFTLVPLPTSAGAAIQASLIARSSPVALVMSAEVWTQLLPVLVQRRDPTPELLVIDRVVGPLPPSLCALEDALDGPVPEGASPPEAPPEPAPPAALFYNNGSCGRAEAAAIGPAELRAALDLLRSAPSLARGVDDGTTHGVTCCPSTAAGYLFDLWRPLLLGARILDLSGVRRERAALQGALAMHRPDALSLAREDVAPALLQQDPPTVPTGTLGALLRVAAPVGAWLGRTLRGAPSHGVRTVWFFRDLPDPDTLGALSDAGVTAVRAYQVSESAAPCGLAPETARPLPGSATVDGGPAAGYAIPAGVSIRILSPGPDGIGEIAVGGPAVASEALDATRTLVPLARVDGHVPTGDVGRLDTAGRLHVLGTRTFALQTPQGTLTGEQVAAHYEGGPWKGLVVVPERLLWPEDMPESLRWVAIVHGAEAASARRFLLTRAPVVPRPMRIDGLVCSPAPFPLGTHGRLRREALLGALRSAFAAHGSTAADRGRIIDWLSPATPASGALR